MGRALMGLVLAIALWVPVSIARAQPGGGPDVPDLPQDPRERRGGFRLVIPDSSPLSPIEAQTRRYHIKPDKIHQYTLSEESFEVYIPDDFDPTAAPYGLVIWVSASKSGAPSKGWGPILSKHKLLWIGPNSAGNDRGIGARIGLALDAAEYMQKTYDIDGSRIYAAGVSGGGKIASMLGVIYPEVFSGAVPIAGAGYFRITAQFPPIYQQPALQFLERAKTQNRFAFLTGSNDFNRESVQAIQQLGFVTDGFKYTQYIEVPGMGHGVPEAQWVEQAIESLDAPLPAIAKDQFSRAQVIERGGRGNDALAMYKRALPHLDPPLAEKAKAKIEELQKKAEIPPRTDPFAARPTTEPSTKPSALSMADRQLALADNFIRNRMYPQARERLQTIVKDYPGTPAAERAKSMLAGLPK